jgi:hypothetical protein
MLGTFPFTRKAVDHIPLPTQTVTVPVQRPGQSAQICSKKSEPCLQWNSKETDFFRCRHVSVYYRYLNLHQNHRDCKSFPLKRGFRSIHAPFIIKIFGTECRECRQNVEIFCAQKILCSIVAILLSTVSAARL